MDFSKYISKEAMDAIAAKAGAAGNAVPDDGTVTALYERSDAAADECGKISRDAAAIPTGTLCETARAVAELSALAGRLQSAVADACGIMEDCAEYMDSVAVQYVMKRCAYVVLLCRRLACIFRIRAAQAERKRLESFARGKAPAAADAALSGLMATLAATAQGCGTILAAMQKLLSAVPKDMLVVSQGMTIYMTPRSIARGIRSKSLVPANEGLSVTCAVAEEKLLALSRLKDAYASDRAKAKAAAIAAAAAAGAASALTAGGFSIGKIPAAAAVSPAGILESMDGLLAASLQPEALPKYERVSLANVGFLMWLTEGFIPAQPDFFGIPGQP